MYVTVIWYDMELKILEHCFSNIKSETKATLLIFSNFVFTVTPKRYFVALQSHHRAVTPSFKLQMKKVLCQRIAPSALSAAERRALW